jgi:spore germination protein GerM
MLVFSIVHTLTANLPAIRQVQILVNGQPAETLAGHVSIERPLRPTPRLVRPQPTQNQ